MKQLKNKVGWLKGYTLALLVAVFVLGATIAPLAVSTVSATCTDAQVNAWLAQRNLTRTGANLNNAYTALNNCPNGGGVIGFVGQLGNILNTIVPFLVALAVFLVIYGVLGYISKSADEEKRKEAQAFITWGIVGIFVMVSVWGLVTLVSNSFNLNNTPDILTQTYAPLPVPNTQINTVLDLINQLLAIGSRLIPFFVSTAVFIVILGIISYVRHGDNEEKRAEGRMFIIWGIVSIFVMLSIWGLVNIVVGSFDLNNAVPAVPELPILSV
ncbi:MAG: hypothetical protein NUV54_01405 [Candidatus Taylorbacteria bacterium]|nr:hypothetical protein [Candidatus Taylorbacteria bacterium]